MACAANSYFLPAWEDFVVVPPELVAVPVAFARPLPLTEALVETLREPLVVVVPPDDFELLDEDELLEDEDELLEDEKLAAPAWAARPKAAVTKTTE